MPCIVILIVTVLATWLLLTNLAQAVMSHSSYWLLIPLVLSMTTIIGMAILYTFEQGIVSNVACVSCYLAFASNMAFQQLLLTKEETTGGQDYLQMIADF